MATESIILIILLAAPGVIVTIMVLINYERYIPEYLEDNLLKHFSEQVRPETISKRVDFSSLSALPAPVARYLKHVLTEGQPFISIVKINQTGKLKTKTSSKKWLAFTAKQLITPITPGFVWDAKIKTPFKTWLRVSDGYIAGRSIAIVDFLSTFPLTSESNVAELNTGALYRFLAEAVWCPTALLPESGVEWTPISDASALATLTDGAHTVSLEFHFNDKNEVFKIYTNSRYQKCNDQYYSTAWEGHFENYIQQRGMRVPSYGEVGWYSDGEWKRVWKANITNFKFNFYANP